MKIALVSPYDFAYPGGVVNHITALDRCFTRMGHTVKVIAPASSAVSVFGDRFIPIGKPRTIPTRGSICRITVSLRLASTIKEVLTKEKFDVIHLHEPFMPMLCSAILRFSDTVNVATFHACRGFPSYYLGRPITTYFLKRRARKLSGKIAVSSAARDFAAKFVPGEYAIIPNGVDLDHFRPDVPPLEEFRDGKLNILFVGRLEGRKGLGYLLKAYRRVKREIPETRLIVVGPGKILRHRYERWIKNHRLEDVVFTGFATYDSLPEYFSTADVFCSPATGRESFGMVLLEAMAMGKPVVASDIEGYRCVITPDHDGVLVPPKNEKALAQALISLLGDAGARFKLGENGRKTAERYGWDGVAGDIYQFYLKAIIESSGVKPRQLEPILV
ncbi:MAG: glycosyltransferase family 4 protein [Chloroflexota bacterium]